MISPRKNQWLIVSVLMLLAAAAWASEPNETPIVLEFEISPTPLGPYSVSHLPFGHANESGGRSFAAAKPTYAADIVITGPTRFLPFPRRGAWNFFLREFAMQRAGLSEGQKALLLIVQEYFERYPSSPRDRIDPNHPEHLWLYAVTPEDARKMAQAYYQLARTQFRDQVKWQEGDIRKRSELIARAEKRIPEVDKLAETTQKSWDDLMKTVPYRNEDEARNAIGELDRMLTTAQVDVAGIEAKIAALREYRGNANQDMASKLDLMLVDELVALRGAEARRQMATRLRTQVNQFLHLKLELARVTGEKQSLPKNLATHQQELLRSQHDLESLKDQEAKIPAKVVIYPVRWADEPLANN